MATVNYRLVKVKSSSNNQIHIYISQGRGNLISKKTGFTISPNDWSKATKRPKQNNEKLKDLNIKLKKLETFVLDKINDAKSVGEIINSYWLGRTIDEHFGRTPKNEVTNNLLVTQIQYIVENANTQKVSTNKMGLAFNTIRNYKTFLTIIKTYEKALKRNISLNEVSSEFVEKFINWLINEKGYSLNTSGKQIAVLKSVCNNARRRGYNVNSFVSHIRSFKENKDNRYIITLSFDELEQIRTTPLTKDYLINARKWLLIGCQIGQRGGDLLELKSENFRYSDNILMLDLTQEKGDKYTTVPITNNYIEQLIVKEFPHKISSQNFNKYIKEVCKIAKIDEPTKGKVYNPKTKRKEVGIYPKYELITSHLCRRSFATNYYKHIPTPILMEITQHSKEETFYSYIGKPKDKDANAKLFVKLVKEMNKELMEKNLKAV